MWQAVEEYLSQKYSNWITKSNAKKKKRKKSAGTAPSKT
jgi:hypothetical protein